MARHFLKNLGQLLGAFAVAGVFIGLFFLLDVLIAPVVGTNWAIAIVVLAEVTVMAVIGAIALTRDGF